MENKSLKNKIDTPVKYITDNITEKFIVVACVIKFWGWKKSLSGSIKAVWISVENAEPDWPLNIENCKIGIKNDRRRLITR